MIRVKQVLPLLIALSLIVLFVIILNQARSENDPSTNRYQFVIGAVLPKTGNLAYSGQEVERGLRMSIEDHNASVGDSGPQIVLCVEDNFGRTQGATSAFQKLVDLDGAIAVVSIFTPLSKALIPLSDRQETLLYATVTSVTEFAKGHRFVFRDFISLPKQCEAICSVLAERQDVKAVSALAVNDDYGRDALRLCREECEQRGIQWVGEVVFEQNAVELRSAVIKALSSDVDCVFIVGREMSLANAILRIRELGYSGLIACLNGFDSPTVFRAVGVEERNLVFSSTSFNLHHPETSEQVEYIRDYMEKFRSEYPHQYSVYGYVVGQALCRTIDAAGPEPSAMVNFLENYAATDLAGTVRMSIDHDVNRSVAVYWYLGGSVKKIE